MKNTCFFIFGFLFLFLLACEGDRIDTDKASRGAVIYASIERSKTRMANAEWSSNDAIGVYMKKSGVALSGASVSANNIKYTTSGSSSFSVVTQEEEIIFPFNGSDVDFIGYYPFKETISEFVYPVDVSNQATQANIDLLYSANATALNSKSPYVNMLFTHQLSKITLNLQAVNSVNLSGISVKITNTPSKASFNLSSGVLSDYSDAANIDFCVNNDGSLAEAILLPTTNLSNKELVISFGELTYVYPLSNSTSITSFEKSTKYIYNISLNPGEGKMAVVKGDITNWTNGPSETTTLNPDNDYVDNSKGTKDNPYTVEEAIQNQGKTGVWVKGYIIGYFSSSSKNSFTTDMSVSGNISQSNFVISSDASATSIDGDVLPVNIPTSTKIRNYINLRDNPTHLGKEILLKGTFEAYFTIPGIKSITNAVIDGVEYPQ